MAMSLYLGGRESALNFGLNQFTVNLIGIIYLFSIFILYSRFSFGWLTIGSKLIQDRYKLKLPNTNLKKSNSTHRKSNIFVKFGLYLYHENFMIFWLPLIGIINYFFNFDIRFIYALSSVFILFPACLYEVYSLLKYNKLEDVYYKIYCNQEITSPNKIIYFK